MCRQTESLTDTGLRLLSKVIGSLSEICDRRYPRDTVTSVAHYHCTRALGLLRAIQVLLKEGLPWEAAVLNRSLLNLLINFAWLTSGYSTVRLQWFADCEVLTKRGFFNNLRCMGEISEEQYHLYIERLQPDWDEFCRKYGYTHPHKPPTKWGPKPIKDLAYDLKDHPTWHFFWRTYESAYRYLSAEEHTDPRAVLHHLELESEESKTREVSEDDCETPLVETCRYGIAVILTSNDVLNSQKDKDIDSLKMELGELQNRLKQKLQDQGH